MDDGNKPFLIGQIQNLKSGTKGVLLDQLLGIAPFVSLEVMEVLLSKVGNPLTKSEFKEIALANPDVFVNNLFVTECIQNGLLSQAEMNDLQIRVTDRTILENEISELYAAKYSTCNEAISIIVGNPELFSKEEIVIWLDNKNSLFSDMAIVDYLINQLNFSEARTLLNKLSEKYQLSFDEQEELDNFIQIKELQITLKKENIAIDKLSLQLIEILEPIAINGKGLAGDQVRTILNQNGGKYFVPPVFPKKGGFEEEVSEIRANIENNLVSFDSENNLLLAKPNPASSEIIFSYKLQESKPCVIIVRDHIGTVITELTVNDSFGAITWNCTNSKPGVYFYSLETIGQLLIEPKRILILR